MGYKLGGLAIYLLLAVPTWFIVLPNRPMRVEPKSERLGLDITQQDESYAFELNRKSNYSIFQLLLES